MFFLVGKRKNIWSASGAIRYYFIPYSGLFGHFDMSPIWTSKINSDPQSLRGPLYIGRYTNHRTPFREESFSALLLSIPISKSNHSVTIFWMFPPPSRRIYGAYTWHFLYRGISAVNAQLYLSCSGVPA